MPGPGYKDPEDRGSAGHSADDEAPRSADRVGVVVVAAGESRRMAGADKIFSPLLGLALIAHSVEVFERCPLVAEIVLVLSAGSVGAGELLARERSWRKLSTVCAGGPRRQDSVRLGLERLSPYPWVAIHDGARPCIEPGLLERGVECARETGAAVAAVPANDTIKVVSPAGLVEDTPSRDRLWAVQTPQIFRYDLLLQAHRNSEETITDDASMVEALGNRVRVFTGSYSNLKVTTPEDLIVAQAILGARVRTGGSGATPSKGS